MNRLLCFLALALLASAQLEPGIEVATVKPSRPGQGFSLGVERGGANVFTTTATSVRTLIQFANGVHPRQIYGPAWIDSEHYDITAKSDQAGSPGIPQMRVMMRKVLADRFNLVTHREKKELAVFAITIAKGGSKLAPHPGPPNNQPFFGFNLGSLNIKNSTITEFAGFLQANVMEQPVIDKTGLTDRFDFLLRYTPDSSARLTNVPNALPQPSSEADAPPDLFTAFQQQLGLKLESTRALVDVWLICLMALASLWRARPHKKNRTKILDLICSNIPGGLYRPPSAICAPAGLDDFRDGPDLGLLGNCNALV